MLIRQDLRIDTENFIEEFDCMEGPALLCRNYDWKC
jgi:hypothetical protein